MTNYENKKNKKTFIKNNLKIYLFRIYENIKQYKNNLKSEKNKSRATAYRQTEKYFAVIFPSFTEFQHPKVES